MSKNVNYVLIALSIYYPALYIHAAIMKNLKFITMV